MENINIEDLRAWVRGQGKFRQLADSAGVPYDTVCKFAYGKVKDPRWSTLSALIEYRRKSEAA